MNKHVEEPVTRELAFNRLFFDIRDSVDRLSLLAGLRGSRDLFTERNRHSTILELRSLADKLEALE
jgi:hypothetical protein